MNKIFLILYFVLPVNFAWGQYHKNSFFMAKEFSKELSEFRAKTYLIEQVLTDTNEVQLFEVEALAASNSGELTTLIYRSKNDMRDGLILGFYGNYWSEVSGVNYQGYNFRHYEIEKANDFLKTVKSVVYKHEEWLITDIKTNNIYMNYDDMKIVIYAFGIENFAIRIHWDGFDAEWDMNALLKTMRKLDKSLKD